MLAVSGTAALSAILRAALGAARFATEDVARMGELFAAVVSITSTKRRRFFWAAWWTAPPKRVPFAKPDASDGGAATRDAAIAAAEARAGAPLTAIDPLWARAWMRVLRGEEVWPSKASREPARAAAPHPVASPGSIWELLGVANTASAAELRAAYKKRALELHPDHGGDAGQFRRLVEAYAEAKRRIARPKRGAGV